MPQIGMDELCRGAACTDATVELASKIKAARALGPREHLMKTTRVIAGNAESAIGHTGTDSRSSSHLILNEMWWALKWQAVGLATVLLIFQLFEKRKALRGADRVPMNPYVEIALRLCFIICMLGPFAAYVDYELAPFPMVIPLLVLYAITYCDLSELMVGGGRKPRAREWRFWGWIKGYFHLRVIKTAELVPGQRYILGMHPHSILPFGCVIGIATELQHLFPWLDYRVLAATFVAYVPFYRDLCLAGGIVDASRPTARALLEAGRSLALCPGGATEALYTNPAKDIVYLRKRHGFIKLALEHGASLVPVFSFNECNTFSQFEVGNAVLDAIKSKFQRLTGLSLPLIKNIIPRRAHITVVIGSPIAVPHVPEPSEAQVAELLERYVRALEDLYNANRELYSPGKPPLEVV